MNTEELDGDLDAVSTTIQRKYAGPTSMIRRASSRRRRKGLRERQEERRETTRTGAQPIFTEAQEVRINALEEVISMQEHHGTSVIPEDTHIADWIISGPRTGGIFEVFQGFREK